MLHMAVGGPGRQTRARRARIEIIFTSLACAVAWQTWHAVAGAQNMGVREEEEEEEEEAERRRGREGEPGLEPPVIVAYVRLTRDRENLGNMGDMGDRIAAGRARGRAQEKVWRQTGGLTAASSPRSRRSKSPARPAGMGEKRLAR
ncbi:hypothetical protein EV356DRAFT_520305 [Viridothelium virens]|uniref:Uncharacterized protein n=1 Tax=Viridothelium virens TaxID=1048519 RepID=A0A6A6HI16_VIRVR|nr:hypothetical protein EV356DRAFT_520305 [Viridothelium virens]